MYPCSFSTDILHCYGRHTLSRHFVSAFIWCLWKAAEIPGGVVVCGNIYAGGLPEVIVLAINAVHYGKSIEMPFFTMQFFPIVQKRADILFFEFSFA